MIILEDTADSINAYIPQPTHAVYMDNNPVIICTDKVLNAIILNFFCLSSKLLGTMSTLLKKIRSESHLQVGVKFGSL